MKNKTYSQKLNDRTKAEAPGHGWHSAAYHRYFEGYTEYTTVNSRGRTVIKRVYEGDWYIPDLDKRQKKLQRLSLAGITLLTAVMFAVFSTRNVPGNKFWLSAIVQLTALAVIIWFCTGFLNILMAKEKLTVGEYNTGSRRMIRASYVACGAFFMMAAAYLVFAFIMPGYIGAHLLCTLLSALCGLGMFVANRLETNVPYKTEKSADKAPDDADTAQID